MAHEDSWEKDEPNYNNYTSTLLLDSNRFENLIWRDDVGHGVNCKSWMNQTTKWRRYGRETKGQDHFRRLKPSHTDTHAQDWKHGPEQLWPGSKNTSLHLLTGILNVKKNIRPEGYPYILIYVVGSKLLQNWFLTSTKTPKTHTAHTVLNAIRHH